MSNSLTQLPPPRRGRFFALRAVVASALLATGVVALSVQSAHAAPGDPFDPDVPSVFIAQAEDGPDGTQLYRAITDGDGDTTFVEEGGPAADGVQYNAIGYRVEDNYIYGIVTAQGTSAIPIGALVRIGEAGVVTRVGGNVFLHEGAPGNEGDHPANVGEFADDGLLWVISTVSYEFKAIDVVTGDEVDSVEIEDADGTPRILHGFGTRASDATFSQGFFWGLGDDHIVRLDRDGLITRWDRPAAIAAAGFAGAAWTYDNGDVGFSHNSGGFTQIDIDNPASANPTFTIVQQGPAPASQLNDGTASPGLGAEPPVVDPPPVDPDPVIEDRHLAPATCDAVTFDLVDEVPGLDASSVYLEDADGNTVTELVVAGEGTWTVNTATGEVTFSPLESFLCQNPTPVPWSGVLTNGTAVSGVLSIEYPDPVLPDTGAAMTLAQALLALILIAAGVAAVMAGRRNRSMLA